MSVNNQSFIRAISIATDNANLRVSLQQSGNAALFTGAASLLGGLLLGPRGLPIGATLGGLASYILTAGTFQPLSEILLTELTGAQRQALIRQIINAVDIRNLSVISSLLASDADVRDRVLETVSSFVRSNLGMHVVDF